MVILSVVPPSPKESGKKVLAISLITHESRVISSFNLNTFLQVQSPPSLSVFSFNVKDYMNESKVNFAPKPQQEKVTLSNVVKDRLSLMLTHLQKDVANLVHNATPLYDLF